MNPLQAMAERGTLYVVDQGPYSYVRITLRTDNLMEVLVLERDYGGSRSMNETTFVWTSQDVGTVRAVLNYVESAKLRRIGPHDVRPGGHHRRTILNAIRAYCSALGGMPRTYAAKTLRMHLGDGTIPLSTLL